MLPTCLLSVGPGACIAACLDLLVKMPEAAMTVLQRALLMRGRQQAEALLVVACCWMCLKTAARLQRKCLHLLQQNLGGLFFWMEGTVSASTSASLITVASYVWMSIASVAINRRSSGSYLMR